MNANMKRYDDLLEQAAKIGSYENRRSVEYILGEAAENAGATVNVEKALPVSDWEYVFIGSVATLLCTGEYNKTVCKWFATRGITF
jgi:hypothetical protein